MTRNDDIYWTDVTPDGSKFEVQLHAHTGQFRYRAVRLDGNENEWRNGSPPKERVSDDG